jgi:hypothetical protein
MQFPRSFQSLPTPSPSRPLGLVRNHDQGSLSVCARSGNSGQMQSSPIVFTDNLSALCRAFGGFFPTSQGPRQAQSRRAPIAASPEVEQSLELLVRANDSQRGASPHLGGCRAGLSLLASGTITAAIAGNALAQPRQPFLVTKLELRDEIKGLGLTRASLRYYLPRRHQPPLGWISYPRHTRRRYLSSLSP